MTTVITYQLAYLPTRTVSLCRECLEHADHDAGTLGSVQYGAHDGECDGAHHGETRDGYEMRIHVRDVGAGSVERVDIGTAFAYTLPVWLDGGRRMPGIGESVSTYVDGATTYAMGVRG